MQLQPHPADVHPATFASGSAGEIADHLRVGRARLPRGAVDSPAGPEPFGFQT